ncbi:hypothetical protein [Anabaena sp. UHCC 0253]|uniref:hypothetical protein n=1 Tax=Anabaena sp. UHCC 0253 TaxID=2590019 RepID=UPI0020C3D28F|nr:hypothetical protein [Anabaena sp. UHCC 0253]
MFITLAIALILLFTLKTRSKSKGQDIAARLFNITAANNSNIVTANGSDNIMIDFDRYLENLPQE